MAHTIVISIDGNTDLKEALKLKKDGYCFHIKHINFSAIKLDELSVEESGLWHELGTEAWENHGNINEKKE